jgi:hypothetical protein
MIVTKDYLPQYGEYSDYEKKIFADRVRDLLSAYKEFKTAKLSKNPNQAFMINQNLVEQICLLYINDLKEFKTFHKIDGGTDTFKRAAYLSRWISNLRPIYTLPHQNQDVESNIINEEYASFIFVNYLRTNPDAFKSDFGKVLKKDLIYIFKFKDPQKEILTTLARATQKALNM